jgi:hypothetical protein
MAYFVGTLTMQMATPLTAMVDSLRVSKVVATRTEHDGTITVIMDRYEGKRLNSPNDVVVHSDGSIWFTDSTYGIDSDYQGHLAQSEIGASYVYRVDPVSGITQVVATTSFNLMVWRFRMTSNCSISVTRGLAMCRMVLVIYACFASVPMAICLGVTYSRHALWVHSMASD